MLRPDLFCALFSVFGLAACKSDPTGVTAIHEVRYAGTVSQPAPGGSLVYRMSGVWKLDANGALISGADTVVILDATVYGVTGTTTLTSKTRCVAIVGKDAWAESEVLTNSRPELGPIGSIGVTRLSLVGGVPKGGGGPRDAWYPNGNVCLDRPAAMPAYEFKDGMLVMP